MLYCRCGLLFSASGSNLEKNRPGSDRNQFSGLHSQTCFSCFISSTHKTLYTIFNEDSANQTIKRINGTLPRAWPRRVGLLWWAEQTFKRVNRTLLRTGHRRVGRTAHIRLLIGPPKPRWELNTAEWDSLVVRKEHIMQTIKIINGTCWELDTAEGRTEHLRRIKLPMEHFLQSIGHRGRSRRKAGHCSIRSWRKFYSTLQ